MARTMPNRQGDATRTRLIATAEKLFAAQGVDAVSVRAVTAAAGQGPAAVHYHFGSKEDLLSAVLLDVGTRVSDAISVRVEKLASCPSRPDLADVVRALTDPYLELLLEQRVRGVRWIKIVVQVSRENRPAVTATGQDELSLRLREQVRRALPDTPPERIDQRWPIAVMSFLQSLSRVDEWTGEAARRDGDELAEFYEDLVSFVVGGAERMLT
ncbi:TetR/AcrR family transcriptional regulator [Prescottella equi]|uniref:TetR/AcrR family transcriptional regulator n=1 Tax=Rhodococcus hoagii TaxID=43767 RepID=UPI000A104B6E|nr:TetR/AcrR family transcriptional regulator [Prescottella equi]MBM4588093.1 TetR family transcriptional regulator [Prescottella equi]MBM4694070.1 TetR family transcriptional regulator [Prescottella equi]NKS30821.1 TetR family transcriptional regulator [Prescottella equi]NKS80005.1 TetR family transcriptional regulator [Prescottella equi]ORL83577.1 TetR family transcriptional regulator [Prescottella equi]